MVHAPRAPPRTFRVWLCECARMWVTTMRCGACGGGGRARARAPDGASSGAARANAPATGNARRKVGTRRTSLFTVSKENTKYPRKTNSPTDRCASRTEIQVDTDVRRATLDACAVRLVRAARACPSRCPRTRRTESAHSRLYRIETLSEHDRRTAAAGARWRYYGDTYRIDANRV